MSFYLPKVTHFIQLNQNKKGRFRVCLSTYIYTFNTAEQKLEINSSVFLSTNIYRFNVMKLIQMIKQQVYPRLPINLLSLICLKQFHQNKRFNSRFQVFQI